MSLPPGFLDELRARVTLSSVVAPRVTWDMRKTNRARGDWWAPCPFHQEKTASFHVDDRKGFYYCFGCHAKGDAITFLRESEGLDFMEAVRRLAESVGLSLPAPDPESRQRADRHSRLVEVMEEAVRHFRLQLKSARGAAAREYAAARGLDAAALERFEIGFAPNERSGLLDALTGRGIALEDLVDAGLVIRPEDGHAPHDRFRGRLMFPIRDARGRAIAFGGRALDPTAPAKYLNSPQTLLFDKSRTLYNHGPARSAAARGAPVIVAEGYMDVIALVLAGFEAAVAPLGTAITETQLELLWRLADEPVIALDGDAAGRRAAQRLCDLALPHLAAGRSLRFLLLPEGSDPDDLIRAEGAAAFRRLLDSALPLADLLWRSLADGQKLDTPERRAAFDRLLRETLRRIRDPDVRRHYADDFAARRRALLAPAAAPPRTRHQRHGNRRPAGRRGPWQAPPSPAPETRLSILAREISDYQLEEATREAAILAFLLTHPWLWEEFEGPLHDVEFTRPEHARIATALFRHLARGMMERETLRITLEREIGADPLEKLFARKHISIAPAIRRPENRETARQSLVEEIARLSALRGALREIADAGEDLSGVSNEGLTWRLREAAEARYRAVAAQLAATREENDDDSSIGPYLQALLDSHDEERRKGKNRS